MLAIDLFLKLGPLQSDGTYMILSQWDDLRDLRRFPVVGRANIDFVALRDQTKGLAEYGELLSKCLFDDPAVLADFRQARGAADQLGADFRFRIAIDAGLPELHALRWEVIVDPDPPHAPLARTPRVFFSRFLASDHDWMTGRPQARQNLTTLAVVSAPKNLDPGRFASIDADAWAGLIESSLGGSGPIRWLGAKDGPPATLDAIGATMREERVDLFILVAHGMIDIHGTPRLWLEADGRTPKVESGLDLVERIKELDTPPRLVVLCSCQGAGTGEVREAEDWKVLASLGPRLADVGVPAVVAMQGLAPIAMVGEFLKVFLDEIRFDGQIDRAMSLARARVHRWPEHWMPALFLRLRSGNIRWYTRGFMVDDKFKRWKGLIQDIINNRCTPLLGPGLHDSMIGSHRDLARRWSEDSEFQFPMAKLYGADMSLVAQYLAVTQSANYPLDRLKRHLAEEIMKRFGDATEAFRSDYSPKKEVSGEFIQNVMTKAWESRVGADFESSRDPHAILARLPFKVFLTANPDGLMTAALRRARTLDGQPKRPRRVTFPWAESEAGGALIEGDDGDDSGYEPTEENPLVGHLLGSYDQWGCVPVTEDDYFEYLLKFTENRTNKVLHHEVGVVLKETSLLLMGFQLDDWSFRVLLHALRSFDEDRPGQPRNQVAVQINPEEERVRDPAGAHKFFDEFFQSRNIFVYWGGAEDFLGELWDEWTRS